MENLTKLRLLFLYQHLVRHTDAEHPLSTAQLMTILKEQYKISVSRNTISNDLVMLHNCGLHIEHYESTQNKYYYDGQTYDLAELKILVDAISSAKFITQKKSELLISKLLRMTNAHNEGNLRRHIYAQGRVKTENENGYYIIDAINEAIDSKLKVRFKYTDFDVNKQKYISNEGESYTVSPYDLVWDGEYYYMRGYCDERQAMRNFRIDRIDKQPDILEEAALCPPDDYDAAEYSKKVFRMYDTDEPVEVELLCEVNMMKYIIDNFGGDVDTKAIDDTHFMAKVKVCPSLTFYRWIFGFEGKVKIKSPGNIAQDYREKLLEALRLS